MCVQVPSYLHAVHHFPYEDTDTPNEDTEIAASEPESMTAINGRRQQLLHGVGAGSNEDAYKTAVRRHWIMEGDLRIAQVPTAVGYDVHVAGPRGDALRATLRGTILFVLDSQTQLRAHEHIHTHAHTRARAHTHTHTHTHRRRRLCREVDRHFVARFQQHRSGGAGFV